MKRQGREWMYERLDVNKRLRIEYANGVREFISHAKEQDSSQRNNGKMRCPCAMCNNTKFLNEAQVKSHLLKKGFCVNYYNWVCHGEDFPIDEPDIPTNPYQDMVNDALRDRVDTIREEALNAIEVDETPNPEVQAFFEMLKKAEERVCEGSDVSVLQAASRLLSLKCEFNLPHKCVDSFISFVSDILPKNNLMATNFYETKKLLKALELPHEKIDVCSYGCMLFWEEDKHLVKCKKCGQDRYKPKTNSKGKQVAHKVLNYFPITHRLQKIYATKHIAKEMRWHAENPRASGSPRAGKTRSD
ncbi:uncharacterized protein LOC141605896 isoform X1 [Silene latifolia]|uniref:uncharacterized protein LOC141605896 isoform X1 n=1 Tax=Silene latifolia TaxID=37657 RepID=UPI003D772DE8